MSFQWTVANIIAAIGIVDRVVKVLHDPADTAPHMPELGRFLRSLGITLSGLIGLLRDSKVKWEDDLVEHAEAIKIWIEDFVELVEQDDWRCLVPGSSSMTAQLALADVVKNLQNEVSRSQLVLDMFINLRALSSLLEVSRESIRTVEQLKTETSAVCHILPIIALSVTGLDDRGLSQIRELKDVQQHAEPLVRGDLENKKTSLEPQGVQIPLSEETRAQWQGDLVLAAEELCACCSMHLNVLLGRSTDVALDVADIERSSWQKAIKSLVRIVDRELGGRLIVASSREFREEPTEKILVRGNSAHVSLAQPDLAGTETKAELLKASEGEQVAVTISSKKPVQGNLRLPITAKSVLPTSKAKEMIPADSSDKMNSYMKSTQLAGKRIDPGSNTSGWGSSSAFSKPTWGSKSNPSNSRPATPVTRFQQRIFQRQNKSAPSQKAIPKSSQERPTKPMLEPNQYSFALERWMKESDPLEMLLNIGEQNGKQEIGIPIPENDVSGTSRFPQVLLKPMVD